jgi:hypothetical protein
VARLGLAASALGVLLTFTVAVLGPSVVVPALPGSAGQPPWSLAARPDPQLVVALQIAAIGAATAGLGLMLRAARVGWQVKPAVLATAGLLAAVALALVPPVGSSDHLSYAAYGRMAALGHDPYTMTPAALARLGDPIGRAVQQFRSTPSVYGAVATAGQALASDIGGTSVRLTVFVLSALNVVAFALTGLLLHRLARGDRGRQLRAAVLWTANPLLLIVLVGGQHVDAQAVVFVIAAVAVFGRCSLAGPGWSRTVLPAAAAGALVGLAFAVKISMVLAGLGLATACLLCLPRWRASRLAAAIAGLAAGFVLVAGVSLAVWGTSSLRPALRAGSMTSFGSPWRAVRAALGLAMPSAAAEDVVKAAAVMLAVVLAVLLLRQAVWPAPRRPPLLAPGDGPLANDRSARDNHFPFKELAPVTTASLAIAWLFAWPYVLPWYDALGWALVALLAWSELDWLLLARTSALAVGYLAATGAALPGGLGWLDSVVRKGLTPAVLLTCLILLLRAARPARMRS